MKLTKFRDVPQYTRAAGYCVDIPLRYLPDWLHRQHEDQKEIGGFQMDPDFQRAHVWDETRQVRYVMHLLRGGDSARDIYWNHPGWNSSYEGTMVLVDGKQRLGAILMFLHNEIEVYGTYFKDFEDPVTLNRVTLKMHVNDLATRAEVLQWYLDINAGGVAHTDEEIAKVQALLDAEK